MMSMSRCLAQVVICFLLKMRYIFRLIIVKHNLLTLWVIHRRILMQFAVLWTYIVTAKLELYTYVQCIQ